MTGGFNSVYYNGLIFYFLVSSELIRVVDRFAELFAEVGAEGGLII